MSTTMVFLRGTKKADGREVLINLRDLQAASDLGDRVFVMVAGHPMELACTFAEIDAAVQKACAVKVAPSS